MTHTGKLAITPNMRLAATVTHFGHTSFGVEVGDYRALIDPMMFDRIKRPPLRSLLRSTIPFNCSVDHVFISHAHTDHFHLPTLLKIDRRAYFHIYGRSPDDGRAARKVAKLIEQLQRLGFNDHEILFDGSVVDASGFTVEAIGVPDSIDDVAQCAFLIDVGIGTVFDGVDMLLDEAVATRVSQHDVALAFLPSGYSQQSSAGRNQMTPFDAYKFSRIVKPRVVAPCGGAISVHHSPEDRPRSISSYPSGPRDWLSAVATFGVATAEPPQPSVYRLYATLGSLAYVSQETLRTDQMPNWLALVALYFSGYDFEDVVEPIDWLTAESARIQYGQTICNAIAPSLSAMVEDLSRNAAPALNRTRFGQLAPRTTARLHLLGAHAVIGQCVEETSSFDQDRIAWIDKCFATWRSLLESKNLLDAEMKRALVTDLNWTHVHIYQSMIASSFPREPWIKDQVAVVYRVSVVRSDLELGLRVLVTDAARHLVDESLDSRPSSHLVFPTRRGVMSIELDSHFTRILILCREFSLIDSLQLTAVETGCPLERLTEQALITINALLEASTFSLELRTPTVLDFHGAAEPR